MKVQLAFLWISYLAKNFQLFFFCLVSSLQHKDWFNCRYIEFVEKGITKNLIAKETNIAKAKVTEKNEMLSFVSCTTRPDLRNSFMIMKNESWAKF